MEEARILAEKLKRKIISVRDLSIRRAVIAAELADIDVELLAHTLDYFVEQASSGSPHYKDVLSSLGDFSELVKRAGREKIDALYDYCVRECRNNVATMLRRIPPKRVAEDHPEDVYIDRDLKDLALGARKTMGRTGNRDLINRLLHDQDPSVIEQILTNPGITEDHVVRIAAKRPTNGDVLRKIGNSNRWGLKYRVRRALVFNPYTPTELSINFLRLLMRQDIAEVAADEALHFELRMHARRILNGE